MITKNSGDKFTIKDNTNMKRDYTISLLFEPRDLWIGIYWNKPTNRQLKVYLCLVPMFPIVVYCRHTQNHAKHHR